jgi:phosphoglycerol transferase
MPAENTAVSPTDRLLGDDAPGSSDARPAPTTARPAGRVRRVLTGWFGEAVAVVLLSTAAVAHVFHWDLDRLRAPIGLGDLMYAYATASLWARGAPFGDDSLGFPAGMHLPYYPTGDLVHNALAGLLGQLTSDPFLPLNLVFVSSFPLTALAALWLLRVVGVRGPLAVVGALGLTTIPFHWLRPDHIYLATMYTAVLAVVLAVLVGSGRLGRVWHERRWPELVTTGVAVVLIGTGGIYYACFAVLLVAVAALYRAFRAPGWRAALRTAVLSCVPAVLVVAVLGATLLPGVLWVRAHPPLSDVAERLPVESVLYSGSLSLALLPTPLSDLPGAGPLGELADAMMTDAQVAPTSGFLTWANSGSVFTMICIAVVLVGSLVLARRRAAGRVVTDPAPVVRLSLVLTLLVGALLFFVPWGLNFLFATLVTPQIRGWERLIPVLFALVVAAAGVVWRDLRPRSPRVGWVTAGVLAVVVTLDSVTPYRAHLDGLLAAAPLEAAAGHAYAADLDAAVPGDCGVLQLPYVPAPEVPPVHELTAYGHFLAALTNPDKRWSFGAIKATPDSVLPEQIGSSVEPDEVDRLVDAGFCAVHVDTRGYFPQDLTTLLPDLEAMLGAPVATGRDGTWVAFALPSS